jgi:hypothetical protein
MSRWLDAGPGIWQSGGIYIALFAQRPYFSPRDDKMMIDVRQAVPACRLMPANRHAPEQQTDGEYAAPVLLAAYVGVWAACAVASLLGLSAIFGTVVVGLAWLIP